MSSCHHSSSVKQEKKHDMLTFVDIQIIKPCEATRVSWLYACATWGAWDKVELANLALMGRMTASFYIIHQT